MILQITSSFPASAGDPRGHFVAAFAQALGREGLPVKTLTPGTSHGRLFGHAGIPANLMGRPLDARHFPRALAEMARAVEANAPSHRLVIAHWLLPFGLMAAHCARRHGLPTWIICHSGGVHAFAALPSPVRRALSRPLANCGHLSFVTERLRDKFLKALDPDSRLLLGPRCEVLPMGLHTQRFRAVQWDPRGPLLILGRLTRLKGVAGVIDALAEDWPGRALRVVGDGPEGARLRERARRRRLKVDWLGELPHDQVARAMDGCAGLVLATRRSVFGREEGLPLAALEALAGGLPVASTSTWQVPHALAACPGVLQAPDVRVVLSELRKILPASTVVDVGARRRAVRAFDWRVIGARAAATSRTLMASAQRSRDSRGLRGQSAAVPTHMVASGEWRAASQKVAQSLLVKLFG